MRIERVFPYARPSFVTGLACMFDWSGVLLRLGYGDVSEETDTEVLQQDWAIVGQDMWDAMSRFEAEYRDELRKSV
ncbi:MAG: hypothetical protein F4X65_07155 [Chloroflexi bacterium]|nr:hypothetical protein [Chloroflexota bacterium]